MPKKKNKVKQHDVSIAGERLTINHGRALLGLQKPSETFRGRVCPGPSGPGRRGRTIVLVGHDFMGDAWNLRKYIQDIQLSTGARVLGNIDTIRTIRRCEGAKEGIGEGLTDIVRQYDVVSGDGKSSGGKWQYPGAHNAGVDAAVNLSALLGLCLDGTIHYLFNYADFVILDGNGNPSSATLDLTKPVPFPFCGDPIFVCVDIEHKEYEDRLGNKPCTEFGFAVLDTQRIQGIPPGDEKASNWVSKFEYDHIIVKEWEHWRQTAFNRGDPKAFEALNYGKSEVLPDEEIDEWIHDFFWALACRPVASPSLPPPDIAAPAVPSPSIPPPPPPSVPLPDVHPPDIAAPDSAAPAVPSPSIPPPPPPSVPLPDVHPPDIASPDSASPAAPSPEVVSPAAPPPAAPPPAVPPPAAISPEVASPAASSPTAASALDFSGPPGPGGLAASSQGDDEQESEIEGEHDITGELIRGACAHELRFHECRRGTCSNKDSLCRAYAL
ncbi:MAG: hypothetical protein LQ349_007615, partial [Xanthoria aureola]